MARTSDYTISDVTNDLLFFWEGYAREGDLLVKRRPEITEEITPITDVETIKVSKFRREGSVVALKKRFGELVFDATHIIINFELNIPIKRKDFRVELTKYVAPGTFIGVQLAISEPTTELVIEDEIPITEITYSTFVKGEYKKAGVVDRRIIVNGNKKVVIGSREPIGQSALQFWNRVFNRLKSDVIDEFKDRLTIDQEFESGELDDFPDWEVMDEGDFPRNPEELR